MALSRATADRDRARERVGQADSDLRKRKIEAVNLSSVDHGARGRLAECTLAALRAGAAQADAYREKEARERVIADLAAKAAADRGARERVRDRLREIRTGWQEKQAARTPANWPSTTCSPAARSSPRASVRTTDSNWPTNRPVRTRRRRRPVQRARPPAPHRACSTRSKFNRRSTTSSGSSRGSAA
ncbi:hypothetical protein [Frigoriglobus tundricola]|uniref:Uncharacterized protein n=1 Tax=Frigoriglobus tundricola TaxID=2774151 RepID=A0A6M5YUU0_9BACT|nr:hypothetical protein [Frigoriglobus tundricola]QJW97204.1 hypothetical protein FTUN_4771 [Frigoriglobus tundricola]